jgi:hypothetical protein
LKEQQRGLLEAIKTGKKPGEDRGVMSEKD